MHKYQSQNSVVNLFSSGLAKRTVLIIIGLGIAMVAIFPLSAWAEAVEWHHSIQHLLIFSAGTIFGSVLLNRKQDETEF